MPEGPEVTLMAEELNKEFDGCLLQKIIIHGGRYKRHSPPKYLSGLNKVLPLKIKHIGNKGKFVFLELDKGWAIGIQPLMTGHFWTPEVSEVFKTMEGYVYNSKHNHWEFRTTCGSFFFNDPRQFGRLCVFSPGKKEDTLRDKLKSLGPDLLKDLPKMSQKEFNILLDQFQDKKELGRILLLQKFISGVGNYIRAEALYASKLSPFRTKGSLSLSDKRKLKNALEKIGGGSYKCQKSNGLHKFTFKVFRKPGVQKAKQNGRTIWWDSKRQR